MGLFCAALAACGGGADMQADATAPASQTVQASALPVSASSGATTTATHARFNLPIGIARDASGNLYVADSGNHTIRKISTSGQVTTLAGLAGTSGSADGSGAAARFSFLQGVAVDGAGNVYAVDNSAIRKITAAGAVSTLAGAPGVTGDADGPGATARFAQPWGIVADAAGNLYVADTGNYLIRKVAPDGRVSTLAGSRGSRGNADGRGAAATFLGPKGIARNAAGNLYVTDWYGPPAPNLRETSTFIRRITTDGAVDTLAGSFGGDGAGPLFSDTFAIAADAAGNVYVAAARSVRRVGADGVIGTVAGPSPGFQSLEGLSIDDAGNLYVCDTPDHAISRIASDGTITVIAGQAGAAGAVDAP